MELTEHGTMLVPRAKVGLPPISLDIRDIKQAEVRIQEVATVTPHKAPELLATFNRVCLDVAEWRTFLEAELNAVSRLQRERRAKLLIETVPGELAKLDMGSSKDLRDAIIEQDPEYQAIGVRVDELTTAIAWLDTKYDGFEMAYNSVKKILGGSDSFRSTRPVNSPVDVDEVLDPPAIPGFGNSRY